MADKNTNIKLNLIAEIKNGKAVGDLSLSYEDLGKAAEVAAKSLKKVNKLGDASSWSSVLYSTSNALQTLQSQLNVLSGA